MCISLAKKGYFQGDPDRVLEASVSTVMKVLAYEKFESEYKETEIELNKNEGK